MYTCVCVCVCVRVRVCVGEYQVGNAGCPESNYCLPHAANATEPKGGWPCSHGGWHTPGGWDHGNYDDCG